MANPYSPAVAEGESAADVWFERSLFDGQYLAAVAYGLHLAVFGITAYFLIRRPKNGKVSWLFLLYVFLLFACGTMNVGGGIKFAEMAWIDDRDVPGGPVAVNRAMYSSIANTLGNVAYITANFLADGILIWRCFVVYNRNYWVMVIPTLAFMASTALSILTLYQAAQPMASLWSHSAVVFAIPYWSLSIALNTVVSMMIVSRLLWYCHTVGKKLGPQHSAVYTSIATLFVESAAMYAITGLVYIICFARNSSLQNLVLGILGQVECIAPELIILRVALGRAWSPETSRDAVVSTNISFQTSAMVDMFGNPHATQSESSSTQLEPSLGFSTLSESHSSYGIPKSSWQVV